MEIIELDPSKNPKYYPASKFIKDYNIFCIYIADLLNELYPRHNFVFLVKGTSGILMASLVYARLINLMTNGYTINIIQADSSSHRDSMYDLERVLRRKSLNNKYNKYIVLDDFSANGTTVNSIVKQFRKIYKRGREEKIPSSEIVLDAYISSTMCIRKKNGITSIPSFKDWKTKFKTVMAYRESD